MEKEIIEGNAIIDVFMGYSEIPKGHYKEMNPQLKYFGKEFFAENYDRVLSEKELKYHTSWNWLHQVWEKFRDLKIETELYYKWEDFKIYIGRAILYNKIEIAFEKLVEAIQWYNNNVKQNQ